MDESDTHPCDDSDAVSYNEARPLEGLVADDASYLDDVLVALADRRRRYALHYLREERRASLNEIAEQIAAWEEDRPVDDLSEDTRAEIEIALYHRHLPQLREADVIDYDEDSEMLAFRDPPEIVALCLEQFAQWETIE